MDKTQWTKATYGDLEPMMANDEILKRYVQCAMDFFKESGKLDELATGAVVRRISKSALKSVVIPVPPREELDSMVHQLDEIEKKLAELENDKKELLTNFFAS